MISKEIQQRLVWIKLYEQTKDFGLVCRRCGISRPPLRKWWKRYLEFGTEGLLSQSKRPHTSPNSKVTNNIEELIPELRHARNLEVMRLQSGLLRLHEISLSIVTIHKVLAKHQVELVKRFRRKTDYIRYASPLPGDRVQMDTCKLAPGLYQYTSIDDCTRYRVLSVYKRRTAENTLDFIDNVIDFQFNVSKQTEGVSFLLRKYKKADAIRYQISP